MEKNSIKRKNDDLNNYVESKKGKVVISQTNNESDTESDTSVFGWHGYSKRYIIPVADKLPDWCGPYDTCFQCKGTPCHKVMFGRYLLKRLVDTDKCYDEWEDFERDFGINYFHASELTKYNSADDAKLYKPNYIDIFEDNSEGGDFFSQVPECVCHIYYAFRNHLIHNKDTNDWSKELEKFIEYYDSKKTMY